MTPEDFQKLKPGDWIQHLNLFADLGPLEVLDIFDVESHNIICWAPRLQNLGHYIYDLPNYQHLFVSYKDRSKYQMRAMNFTRCLQHRLLWLYYMHCKVIHGIEGT